MKKRNLFLALLLVVLVYAFRRATPQEQRAPGAAPAVSLIELMPVDASGSIIFMGTAARTAKADPEGLLSVRAEIKNNESNDLYLDKIVVECSGNGAGISKTIQPDADGIDTIKTGKKYVWQNSRDYHELGDVLLLKAPFPNQVQVKFYFAGFTEPYVITKSLKKYMNLNPGNAYGFPGKDEDLLMNEYWYADAAHGGGGQVFAYDMVVVGWDPEKKAWNDKRQGKTKDENASFRVYGKPVYSIGDGEVLGYINNWNESASTSDTGTAGGNCIKINNGKETICYYHMQKGSISDKMTKIGAKVKKGDFIGLAGNSGNSSGPHVHIHAIADPDKDGQGPFVPLNFNDIYSIDVKSLPEPNPAADWVKLSKTGLPYIEEESNGSKGRAIIWPDERKPCWYPPNRKELARHGIPENQYQAEISKIWSCGYYPVWVDAYDVNGKTFFNAIFRYNSNNYEVVVRHDMNSAAYQQQCEEWISKKGYRLQQLDSYLDGGTVKWAAIFIKKPGQPQQQPAYHAASPEQHQKLFEEYSAKGFVPVNVSVVSSGGKLYYSAFYEKRDVGKAMLKSSLTAEEYQAKFNEMDKQNWEQVYINAYHHDGKTRFSVIWYQNAGYKNWSATRRSSAEDYSETWEDNLAAGRLTRCVTGYGEGGKHWFAAHWSK